MKLKPTQMTYNFEDAEDGRRFTVTTSFDAEFSSWSAYIDFSSYGHSTSEAAVEKLITAAKEFIRQAEEKAE